MGKIFIPEHLILPQGVVSLCVDSHLRTAVLATLPTLDDGGLVARQTGGDLDHGLRIPGASGEQAVPGAAGSGPAAKGKQAVAGSAATSGPSQARSSSGASSGEAGRRRLHRGDGTPVTESAAKHRRTAEDAGQGSSRAPGPRGTSRVAAPPPPPPRDTSPRQQQQQREQPRGPSPKQLFHHRWLVSGGPGDPGLDDDGGCGELGCGGFR
ncbi:collagen alpha-1(III) chain-like [Panicum virgatum]|uniref:collagen alpha-1(III) chain-like n=1 Tax=Panicum virgatum TaxID=38727 RepID=UPI0019D540A7|nr:collagen alpha-1(III) chain-like [Panicum virgatum]